MEGTITQSEYARCDEACKRVLAEKIFLARIMKGCVEEFYDCEIDDIINKYIEGEPEIGKTPAHRDTDRIIGSDTEDSSLHEHTVRYDLRFRAIAPGDGGEIALIINIEAQRRFDPGYPLVKRGLYYCCRLISSQYGVEFTHSHYENIKKVYSIWLCLDSPEEWRDTITSYSVREENLVGHASEKHANYDLLKMIMVCPGDASEPGSLLRLLRVLFSGKLRYDEKKEILDEEYDIELGGKAEEEVLQMCNLSYGIAEKSYNEGVEIGIDKGIGIGIDKGRSEGRSKALAESLRAIMKSFKLDFDSAADVLHISPAEREEYRKLVMSKG